MRKAFAILVAWAAIATASADAAPQRVMSINLCSDQLLLDLLPYDRIASVTWLSRKGYGSYLAEKASHVGINHGTAEEVLAQHPDLVVAGLYTSTATKALLKRVGVPLVEVPPAKDFDSIRQIMHLIGRVLGEEAKADIMVQEMDATLASLAATAPKQQIVIAGWDGSGQMPGPKTLFNAIATAAGAKNITDGFASEGDAKFDLEQILAARPDLLAHGDSNTSRPSIQDQVLLHPALKRLYAGREFTYPQLLYSCGLPQSAAAAKQLREIMLELLAKRVARP